MTPQQFCWWLSGMVSCAAPADKPQVDTIKEELKTVFRDHIDPSYPADKQAALHEAHQGILNGKGTLPGSHIKLRC